MRPRELVKRHQDLKERFQAKAVTWTKGQPEVKESAAHLRNQK